MQKEQHERHAARARELVAQMTAEEKASQLRYDAPAIPRLGIPAYNWWNEGLHGVARAGTATVFPQAIGMAATFDRAMLYSMGHVTGLEARIKYNLAQKQGDRGIYKGLTLWAPNINVYRDPRWGRGHETYGEDPVLTAVCGEAFVRGVQEGEDGDYLLAAACLKHFAVHSGPEATRHGFDSTVSDFDLYDTYLPAFEWCVRRADVAGVMGAYNMINGIPSCASPLIEEVLRGQWGLEGYVVSDCGALQDMHNACKYTHNALESAAAALKAGCDINCGEVYRSIMEAYDADLIADEELDAAAVHAMTTRMELGLFDEGCPYHRYTDITMVECPEHVEAAYSAAAESMVLLKNNGVLPLRMDGIKTVGVIGPNADSVRALEGNYNGHSARYTTVLRGIRELCGQEVRVLYGQGCPLWGDTLEGCGEPEDGFAEALTIAENSDAVVMVMGLDSSIEGEEGDASNAYGAGDKPSLSLPGLQPKLLEAVKATGKPLILVVMAGGALDMRWAEENADAILYAWYPGSEGGRAVADVLFGRVSPGGRLPVTFYKSLDDLPAFEDYAMDGRTYRYLKAEPLYPFGYGLSYTAFTYGEPEVEGNLEAGTAVVRVRVRNGGPMAGSEPVQVYATYGAGRYRVPRCKLCGFERVWLEPGEEREVAIPVERDAVLLTDRDGSRYLPGQVKLGVYRHAGEAR